MVPPPKQSPFPVRFFGGCAVISCLIQWTWVLLFLVYPLLNSAAGKAILTPPKPSPSTMSFQVQLPTALDGVFIVLSLVGTLVLLVLAFTLVPKQFNRSVHKRTEKTAQALLPVVTHHQNLSTKKVRVLTDRIIFWIKACSIIVPFLLLSLVPLVSPPISSSVIVLFGGVLLLITLFWAGLSLATKRILSYFTPNSL